MHRSRIVFARRLASDLIEPLGDYRSEFVVAKVPNVALYVHISRDGRFAIGPIEDLFDRRDPSRLALGLRCKARQLPDGSRSVLSRNRLDVGRCLVGDARLASLAGVATPLPCPWH